MMGNFSKINRVEVIDNTGRAYVNMNVTKLDVSVQDGFRTLKLFIDSPTSPEPAKSYEDVPLPLEGL